MLFYFSAAPVAHRAALRTVWMHTHEYALEASPLGTLVGKRPREMLRAMFERAAFPLPDDLPPVVRIWRGCANGGARWAARGVSWTLDRDVACWFAIWPRLRLGLRGRPLVLAADVPRAALLFHDDGRGEQEVVCFDARGARIDGDTADWMAGYARQQGAFRALQAERVALAAADPSITLYPPPAA